MIKKCETCRIKYKYCDCFLEYTNFKDDLIEFKCLCCNKYYQQKSDEKLKEQFFNTFKFSNRDNNKFILLLQRCSSLRIHRLLRKIKRNIIWKRTILQLPIYGRYYWCWLRARKKINKDFEIKSLCSVSMLYMFRTIIIVSWCIRELCLKNNCLKIYELVPARFLTAPALAWQKALKKIKTKLDFLTDIDMLLMV